MLHLGAPQLTSLASPVNLAAIALLALGLTRAIAGRAPTEPVRALVLVPATLLAAVGWLATPTAVVFAPGWTHAAAFAYIGVVIAWAWMLRDRQSDDDPNDGRGDQNVQPDPPEDPGGGGIDWDAFESDFWAHVAGRRDRDLTRA
jgi:hypothetical protein